MQKGHWIAIAFVLLVAMALNGLLQLLRLPPWLLVLAVAAALLVVVLPWWLGRSDTEWFSPVRRALWREREGVHHTFAGVWLRIEDDGRHQWVDGAGLMRATGRREPEDVLAARHTGRWRRDDRGALMLRVDAVVEQLDRSRGRDDPRILRLKHYLERQVLYPASERRRREGETG